MHIAIIICYDVYSYSIQYYTYIFQPQAMRNIIGDSYKPDHESNFHN